jgi:thiamine-monophosphate kinase
VASRILLALACFKARASRLFHLCGGAVECLRVYRTPKGFPGEQQERKAPTDVSEQELLSAIAKVLSGAGPSVIVGVGDDAAVVAPGTGETVLTTDALVEGTHFLLSTTSARDLGYKAVVTSVSDVAAMAASPRFALCALALSGAIDAAWTMELFGGMREACDEYAVSMVGGNLARASQIVVTVTVTGEVAPGRALTRSGARVGDVVAVTGSLGAAAAGLRVARRGGAPTEQERRLLRALFRPVARVGEAGVLARCGASALIDVSDGLNLDLSRLLLASGVGGQIATAAVPVSEGATIEEALAGGEDYELVVTLPPGSFDQARDELRETFGVSLTKLGDIVEGSGLVEQTTGTAIEASGWDHFHAR